MYSVFFPEDPDSSHKLQVDAAAERVSDADGARGLRRKLRVVRAAAASSTQRYQLHSKSTVVLYILYTHI